MAFSQDLTNALTNPVYMVELGFDPILRLSSGPTVICDNGCHWPESGIRVNSIRINALGNARVSLTINNLDLTMGAVVLNQVAKNRYARIMLTYLDHIHGGFVRDPEMLVDGVMDGASIGREVNISIISRSASYGSTPRVICAPPVFNHLPPPGSTINWGASSSQLDTKPAWTPIPYGSGITTNGRG